MTNKTTFASILKKSPPKKTTTSRDSASSTEQTVKRTKVKVTFIAKNEELPKIINKHKTIANALVDQRVNVYDSKSKEYYKDDKTSGFTFNKIDKRYTTTYVVRFELRTSREFREVKKSLAATLKGLKAVLSIDHWTTHEVQDVAWIQGVHPTVTLRNAFHEEIRRQLEIKNEDVPKFRLYVKTVRLFHQNTLHATTAISIECESKDLLRLRHLMVGEFRSKVLPGILIASNIAQTRNKNTLCKWINNQQDFLEVHHTIPLEGVTIDDLNKMIELDGNRMIVKAHLLDSGLISNISPTNTPNKFNLSTTKEKFKDAIKFVEKTMDIINLQPALPEIRNSSVSEIEIDEYTTDIESSLTRSASISKLEENIKNIQTRLEKFEENISAKLVIDRMKTDKNVSEANAKFCAEILENMAKMIEGVKSDLHNEFRLSSPNPRPHKQTRTQEEKDDLQEVQT